VFLSLVIGYARVIRSSSAMLNIARSTWLEAVEPQSSAVSLRDWCYFQKFLQLHQLAHVVRCWSKAAFQLAHPALKFGA
jgi:hypothetical protein